MHTLQPLKVLLIEDNPGDVLLLRAALETDRISRFEVITLELLKDGLDRLQQTEFDIVLVDLGLPDSAGLATFKHLQEKASGKPIVVFSGNDDEQQAIDAVRAGAQDYIVKSISGFELAARTIRYALERRGNEEKLAVSEKRFRALIENSADAVALISRDGTLIYESPSVERITGYKPEERVGNNSFENIHTDDLPMVKATFAEIFAKPGGFIHATYRSVRKDGGIWWTESTATNLLDEPGVNGIIVNFRDVTDRVQAETELKNAHERFSTAFFTSPISQSIIDPAKGEILAVNDACCILFEYRPEELIGADPGKLKLWQNPADELSAVEELQKTGHLLPRETNVRVKSGEIHTIIAAIEPISWNGTPCLISSIVDITERKHAEEKIHVRERQLQALITSLDDIVFEVDENGTYLNVWTSNDDLLFIPREQIIGKRFDEVFGEEASRPFFEFLSRVLNSNTPQILEYPVGITGSQRWFAARYNPIHSTVETQKTVSILVREITERKQMEDQLRAEQVRFAQVAATVPGAICTFKLSSDGSFSVQYASNAFEDLFGLTLADVGNNVDAILEKIAPEQVPFLLEAVSKSAATLTPWRNEFHYRHPQKGDIWLENYSMPVRQADGSTVWHGVAIDVTERRQIQEKIRQSEEQYRFLFENNPHPMWAYDLKTLKFLAVNGSAVEKYGYSRAEFLNMTISDIRPTEDVERLLGSIGQPRPALQHAGEWRHRLKNGTIINVEISSHTLNLSGHDAALVVALDITERKKAEKDLRESEERLRMTLQTTSDGFWVVGVDRRFMEVNQAYCAMSGYTREEFLQLSIPDIEVIESVEETQNRIRNIIKTGKAHFETRHRRKDGSVFDTDVIVNILDKEKGLLVCFCRDITERKRAEQALLTSEENFRQIAETIQEVFWVFDNQYQKLIYLNPTYENIWGVPVEDTLQDSRKYIQAIHPDDHTIMLTALDRQARGELTEMEYRIVRPDGSVRWIFDRSFPILAEDGRVIHTTGVATDITERKQAENSLNRRVEDLALINKLNDAVNRGESLVDITELLALNANKIFGSQSTSIYLLNPDKDRILLQHFTLSREYVEKLEKLIGGPAPRIELPIGGDDHFSRALNSDEGFLITGFEGVCAWLEDFCNTSYLPSRVRPLIRKIVPTAARLLNIKSVISIPLKSDGEAIGLIEFTAEGEFDESVFERLQNVRHQLTEVIIRKRTEQSLSESEEKYRLLSQELEERVMQRTAEVQDLYDNAPTGYHSLDEHGKFIMINQTELNWLGYTQSELIGRSFADIITPASLATFQSNFPTFMQRGWVRDLEFEMIRKDGSTFPIVLSATAVKDESGNYMMSRSTLFDITERKKAGEALLVSEAQLRESRDELSIANVALEKAARMKDEFLASMSHELRTPLTGILGLSEALQLNTYGELSEKQKKILSNIHDNGEHLLALINDILDLSKIEAGKLEIQTAPSLLSNICQASLQLTKGMAHQKRQKVKFSAPVDPILLDVDMRRIKQIIVNLLSNAIKFTPQDGELGLDIEPDGANQQVRLIVWDKGIGIETENLPKLFQPFVQIDSSLAREYFGTGLGLSLVQHLTELHNGSVEVESTFGKGSRFIVTLPWMPQMVRVDSSAAGHQKEAHPKTVDENTSSPIILVTDDNQVLLEMLTDFLEAKKYRTAEAQSGKELLEKIESIKPDIILMDIQMPGMDGLETIRRVRNHKDAAIASTIIIAVTALAMSGDRERCLEAGANEYMSKPVKLSELTTVIDYLLSSSMKEK